MISMSNKQQTTIIENTPRGVTYQVDVPTRFWDDHVDRCIHPYGDGPPVLKVLQRHTRVALTRGQLKDLHSDADHYAREFRRDPEPWMRGLSQSAKATVRRTGPVLDTIRRVEATTAVLDAICEAALKDPDRHLLDSEMDAREALRCRMRAMNDDGILTLAMDPDLTWPDVVLEEMQRRGLTS